MTLRSLRNGILLLVFVPVQVLGQNVLVDENRFRIYQNGEVVGQEEFSIRQIGPRGQARVILRGTVELDLPEGTLNLAPAMEVQAGDLGVSRYQIKISGIETTDIFVSVSGSRYLVRTVSAAGEQLREYRAGPGSVLLDEHVIHHYHLLNRFLEQETAVSLTVLVPGAGRQQRMTLTLVGEEEIRIGDVLVPDVRRYRLEGGDDPREIWFDTQGRILRLQIPTRGYLAERESMT